MTDLLKNNLAPRNISFGFLSLFAFVQCLSISFGNYIFGISLFFLIISIFSDWKNHRLKEVVNRCIANKCWFLFFGFFLMTMLLSACSSPDILNGLKTWFFKYFYRTFPFFLVIIFFPEPKKVRLLLILSLLSCLTDVLVSLYLGPLPNGRYRGIYGHPMTLAGFLCVSIPVVFAYFFRWNQKPWFMFLEFVCFSVLSIGLLLNQTRGAWIAVFISLSILALWFSTQSLKKFLLLCIVGTSLAISVQTNDQLSDRFNSIFTWQQSQSERKLMWESATNMFKDNPVFGVGLGQYATQYKKHYIRPDAKERYQVHAHSNLFQILGENGLTGLIGFLSLFGFIFWISFKTWIKEGNVFGAITFSVSLSFFIQGLTEFNFGNSAVVRYYWLVLACLVVMSSFESRKILMHALRCYCGVCGGGATTRKVH